jgi:hypothetical protein
MTCVFWAFSRISTGSFASLMSRASLAVPAPE